MDSVRSSSQTEVPGSRFQVPGEDAQALRHSGTQALPSTAAAAEKERLIGRIELLREAWRHARGSQDLFADPKVAKALDLLAEATSRAEQQLVALSGLVAGPPPDEGLVACDVNGVLGANDRLDVGPIAIRRSCDWASLIIRLRDRSEIFIALRPLALDWHVRTDGRDYPEVVKAPPASAGGLSDPITSSLRHSVTQSLPLVSIGQGTSTREITEEDVLP